MTLLAAEVRRLRRECDANPVVTLTRLLRALAVIRPEIRHEYA